MNLTPIFTSPTFTFVIIYGLTAFIYRKVFAKTKRLPILKSVIIYFVLALGCILLNFFQLQVGLPIIPSLLVAVGLMAIVRIRMAFSKRSRTQEGIERR